VKVPQALSCRADHRESEAGERDDDDEENRDSCRNSGNGPFASRDFGGDRRRAGPTPRE
jgi:hypothetical protein